MFLSFGAWAQTESGLSRATHEAVTRLAGSILVDGRAYDYDKELADAIGPRLTGSDAYNRAVEWASAQFRDLGLTSVQAEGFQLSSLWEPASPAAGHVLTPRVQALHIASFGWSPSTPNDGVRGTVFYVSNLGSPDKLKEDSRKIRGSIALVDNASLPADATSKYGKFIDGFKMLNDLGAQAIVYGGLALNNVEIGDAAPPYNGALSPLPVAFLGHEDSELLRRLSTKGQVTIEFAFHNRVRGATEVKNVVAEIRGREKPEEWIVVGGHLDSWHTGTGAQDNGTGAASVIEVARAIKALGRPPLRSIRFILFGGEEQGLVGSTAYVHAHAFELGKCVAVLITDAGAGPAHGWLTFGRQDVQQNLQPTRSLLAGLGGNGTSDDPEFLFGSDQAAFFANGIPSLMLWTETDKYNTVHHQSGDTFDKVDKHTLTEGTAIVAATAYAIADADTFPGHLSRTEVDTLLTKLGKYDNFVDMDQHGLQLRVK